MMKINELGPIENFDEDELFYLEDANPQTNGMTAGYLFNYDDLSQPEWQYDNFAGDWATASKDEFQHMEELLKAILYCNKKGLNTNVADYEDIIYIAKKNGMIE